MIVPNIISINALNRKKNITFKDLSLEWIEKKRKTAKKSTISTYSYTIRRYLYVYLENCTLKELEKYNFNDLVEKLAEELSPKTIRDVLVILKSILRYAQDEYDFNFKINKINFPKLNSEPLLILNRDEKVRLEKYCIKQFSLRNLGVLICLNTGLRIGEICALKWENIDLEKRIISVRSTLQRIYNPELNKTQVIIDTPKSRKSVRDIPISNKLYRILRKIEDRYNPDDFFLTGRSDKYLEPVNYRGTFKRILKKKPNKNNIQISYIETYFCNILRICGYGYKKFE